MITKCPHCKTKFKARDDLKGKNAKCPKCKQPFIISECVVKTTTPIQTTKDLRDKVEVCANCRRGISKRDKAHSIDGKIFCAECNEKPRGTAQVATTKTTRQTVTRESEKGSEQAESGEFFFSKLSKQNPVLGGILNALALLFIFAVLGPMCHMILFPKKQQNTTLERPVKKQRQVIVERPTQRVQKTVLDLPANGVYSEPIGSGGSYIDAINGFFEVEPPQGFTIKEQQDRTTTKLDNGKVVLCSRIGFESGNTRIGVVTRKTFSGTIDKDLQVVLRNYRSAGVKIERSRFVTIDGVRGSEVLAKATGYQLLLVKYKKHGLDHAITISCSPKNFSKFREDFVSFLCSYRSMKYDQDVKRTHGDHTAKAKKNIDALYFQKVVDKYDLNPDQKKIAISYFKEQPCVYTTASSGALKGSDDFLLFKQSPELTPLKIEVRSPQSCVVNFARLYVSHKKTSDIGNSRCALVSFAAIPHPSSKDDLLAFIGYHDPRFTISTTPINHFEAAPAPSFTPEYLSLFPKEFSAVFFVCTEKKAKQNFRSTIMVISRNWNSEDFEKRLSPKSNLIEVKVMISEQ